MQHTFFQAFEHHYSYIYFTFAFLLIVHAAYFLIELFIIWIRSDDFQHKNRSADVALPPDHLPVITVFFLSQNKFFAIFVRMFSKQVGVLKISFLVVLRIY